MTVGFASVPAGAASWSVTADGCKFSAWAADSSAAAAESFGAAGPAIDVAVSADPAQFRQLFLGALALSWASVAALRRVPGVAHVI